MSTTPQFDIPNEMRAVTERSVEQAKVAFQLSTVLWKRSQIPFVCGLLVLVRV